MEILAIVLLLAGVFCTVMGIIAEDIGMLVCAGIFYWCCGRILVEMVKENNASPVAKSE